MSTYMTPGGAGANMSIKEYSRKIEPALYNAMQFIPLIKERAEKIMDGLYVRRLGRVATQTMSTTNDGTTVTFSDLAPTAFQLSPAWVLAAAAYPDSAPRRHGDEIDPAYAANLTAALAAGLDTLVLAEIQAGTTTPIGDGSTSIDAAKLRAALTALETNSKRLVKAGLSELNVLLDTGQVGASLAIPEINNAYQRGDGKSPTVSGRISTGLGFKFDYTTLLASDGNGKHGAAFHGDAIHYGYNQRPKAEKQRYLKQTRLMSDAEIGFETIYQELLQPIRTA